MFLQALSTVLSLLLQQTSSQLDGAISGHMKYEDYPYTPISQQNSWCSLSQA